MPELEKTKYSWRKVFGNVEKWDDPLILDKMRKQAMAVMYAVSRGKKVDPSQYKAAEYILGRLVAPHTSQQVHFHLSLAEIQKAQLRAGLIPSLSPVREAKRIVSEPAKTPENTLKSAEVVDPKITKP